MTKPTYVVGERGPELFEVGSGGFTLMHGVGPGAIYIDGQKHPAPDGDDMTNLTVVHDDHVHDLRVTADWLTSRRGWEMAGGLVGDACAATVSGLRDADAEDTLPSVPASKRAKPKTEDRS